jgi:hypothetical protein
LNTILTILFFIAFSVKIPETILVRITGLGVCVPDMQYVTKEIPFKDYVKGVLPSEWYSSWGEESLKAGAVAAKMYGWATYERLGYVWDCNYHQVYKPWYRTEAADKAVDDTWDWILVNQNGIVKTYYDDYPAACRSRGHECMSQWWTFEMGQAGYSWVWMLTQSYQGILVNPQ